MFTRTCTLTFPDGEQIVAKISAASPHQDVPIDYRGAVERLREYLLKGNDAVLMALMRQQAEELGATLTEISEGEYERWAQ